jgi:hypothetical protein
MAITYSRPGYISVAGRVLLQVMKIDVKFDSGNKDVDTLLLGRAGHSLGPQKVSIDVSSAVPAAGIEGDIITRLINAGTQSFAITFAGTIYNVEGDIRTGGFSTDVGNPNGTDFNVSGKLINTASAA